MEKKWTWDSWSQITKPDGCHCDEAEIERFKEAPVLERKVKNMMLLWTSLIGSIVWHIVRYIRLGIFMIFSQHWSPPKWQKEDCLIQYIIDIDIIDLLILIWLINDHLPEDKEKRPTAKEEDESHDGSNQHHCTQLLCLFYHLERVKVTLVSLL